MDGDCRDPDRRDVCPGVGIRLAPLECDPRGGGRIARLRGGFRGSERGGYGTLRLMRAAAADQVEPAINKYLVAVLAWAVPGGGHLLLRRRQKGVTFLIALSLMFATGLWLEGRIFPLAFDLTQPLVGLAAIADLGIGIP